jgi:hypothetical protein
VETDFTRNAPSEGWSAPERSFGNAPHDAGADSRGRETPGPGAESAAPASSTEATPSSSDERQAS